jgi:DNA polymerase III alpha subunit (gram-positive type)
MPAGTSNVTNTSPNPATASMPADAPAPQPTTQAATPPHSAQQQQPVQQQPSQQIPPKSTFVSLQSMAEEIKPQTPANSPAVNQQFTQHDLDREWKMILSEIKTESPSFHSILANAKPVIKENSIVEIIAENDIQGKEIAIKIKEIRENIRQKLQNDSIEIMVSAAAVQVQKERQPYTAKEKFDALNKTNPQLQNLKNELGLEIEM